MRRLATTLRSTRSFASAPTTPRIAICGAGVSGLTLAGILSNGTRDIQLTVFERARRDRDQGYGLDLDEHGQEALVRAGVYDRYWDISYPYSDTAVGYQFSGGEPLLNIFWPRLTMRLFPQSSAARPETNRGGLRDILLDALAARGREIARRAEEISKYYWAGLCLKNPTFAKGDVAVVAGRTCVSRSPSSMPTMDISSFRSTATGWPAFTSLT